MKQVEDLVKTSMGEIERLLNTKTVVGEPITHEGSTIIPLVSVGFGFGAGGGTGNPGTGDAGEGSGMGTGGGGGVKPVAVIIIDKDGVRLESIKGGATSVMEKVVDVVGKAATNKAASNEAATGKTKTKASSQAKSSGSNATD
ncbi:GerW family sporulation protein [Saccharospirillum impatiens]|uniref:GerW family sporulation protein n=1 Tax=Saccharospirillum impatiens TaxID=169438 RepID=UPI000412C9B4|nr:spore germination protein GerW family protein [Saccharospirillum impatiens]